MSESERPPVDPLREAIRDYLTLHDGRSGHHDGTICSCPNGQALEAALASPAAPQGAEAFDEAAQRAFADTGVEVRTSFTSTDERPGSADPAGLAEWKARHAAAPRPEGLDAAEHDAGTCPTCRSRLCIGRLDYEDCAASALRAAVENLEDPWPVPGAAEDDPRDDWCRKLSDTGDES